MDVDISSNSVIRRRCLGVSLAWLLRARGLDGSLVISDGPRDAPHGGNAAVVLSAGSRNVAPCARRLVASFCCADVEGRGAAHALSSILGAAPAFGDAGADRLSART